MRTAQHPFPLPSSAARRRARLSAALLCGVALALPLTLALTATPASAQGVTLSIGELSPNSIAQGQSVEFTLFGRNFSDGMSVTVSGEGVTSGPATFRPSMDPNGQSIVFTLTAAAGAELGRRNITLRDTLGSPPATKYVAIEVTQGSGDPGQGATQPEEEPTEPEDPTNPQDARYAHLPPRVPGQVNIVTRASPPIGETGGQGNLWLEGREVSNDLEIKFSTPLIEQAYSNNEAILMDVVRNTRDTNGNLDGVIYYIRIAPHAPLGPVNVTVTNTANGSSSTLTNGFEIVARGQGLNIDTQGSDDIVEVTAASPLAIATGRTTAVWVYGQGFNIASTIEFSNPGVTQVSPSRPVINSQNNPGYDGFQNFLNVSPTATPGPVDVTVRNPNGSTRTAMGAFNLVAVGSAEDPGAQQPRTQPIAEDCVPDPNAIVAYVGSLTPNILSRGESAQVSLIGSGLTCASTVVMPVGVNITTPPVMTPDPVVPSLQTLSFTVSVTSAASLGPQAITVVNPQWAPKSNREAFTIMGEVESSGAACSSRKSALLAPALMAALALLFGVARRRARAA